MSGMAGIKKGFLGIFFQRDRKDEKNLARDVPADPWGAKLHYRVYRLDTEKDSLSVALGIAFPPGTSLSERKVILLKGRSVFLSKFLSKLADCMTATAEEIVVAGPTPQTSTPPGVILQ